jgi:hypothetical protein
LVASESWILCMECLQNAYIVCGRVILVRQFSL